MSKKRLFYIIAVLLLSIVFGGRIFESGTWLVNPGSVDTDQKANSTDSRTASDNRKTATQAENSKNSATVTRIIDGDTIVVTLDGIEEKVRLIGIDTPERGKPFYKDATEKTRQLCLSKEVRLVKDVRDRDRYGRLLRYVYVGDIFVNAELVKQGYAMVLTYPPDVKYADLFVSLAAQARASQLGLWAK